MTNDPAVLPPPCERCEMPLLNGESGKHRICPIVGLDDPGRRRYLAERKRRLPRLVALQYRLAAGGTFMDEGPGTTGPTQRRVEEGDQ